MNIIGQKFKKKPTSSADFHEFPMVIIKRLKNGLYRAKTDGPIVLTGDISYNMLKKNFNKI